MKPIYLPARRRRLILLGLASFLLGWLSAGWPQTRNLLPEINPVGAASTFEQSAYRWFQNRDSTAVTTTLAAQDTQATLSVLGTQFRLRMLLHVGTDTLAQWPTQTLDSTGAVGQYTSFTAPTSSTYFISYYDAEGTNLNLKFAKSTNGGSSWTTSTIDSTGDVGRYSSIDAIDTNTIFISYYDATAGNLDLKFAKSTDGGSNWTTSTVDTTGDVGQYSSLDAVDANTIFISYYDATGGDLEFAKSTNGGSSWTTTTVESTNDRGQYSSIGAADANTLLITHYDVTGGDLRASRSTNGGSSWSSTLVAGQGNTGQHTSLHLFDASNAFVVFYHVGVTELRYIETADGGANWKDEVTVDTSGDVGTFASAHALDTSNLYVSYRDATNGDLKIAKSTNGGGQWTTQVVESSGDVGQYTSLIAFDGTTQAISYYDVGNGDLKFTKGPGAERFKLQFAQRGGDNLCDTAFVGETYSDVTASTAMAYYNNSDPADGDALTANANDPTHGGHTVVNQTYEEANNFTNALASIPAGQDGKWDFAIVDYGMSPSTTYCFRAVKSDSSTLDTYSVVPQITTSANSAPNLPTLLVQKRGDTLATISTGGWVATTSIQFEANVTDPDAADTVRLCVEKDLTSSGGDGYPTKSVCTGFGSQGSRSLLVTGLPQGAYHWHAFAEDNHQVTSSYQCYPSPSCNSESETDFGIDTGAPSTSGAAVNDGTGADIDTQQGTGTLSANWSGFTDSVSGINRYEYKIVRDSDGKCLEVDNGMWVTCDSWKNNGLATSFTLNNPPIAVGETYTVGVRAIDQAGLVSGVQSSDGVTITSNGGTTSPPPPVTFLTESPPPEPPPVVLTPPIFEAPTAQEPTALETLQDLGETLLENPIAQTITDITPVVAPVGAATGLLLTIAQIIAQGPIYLSYLWSIILEYLGIKRRRRSWGVVYNAATKEPLPLIVVQLVDAQLGQVVDQRVTDPQGRFGFLVKAGRYQIRVEHPGFVFPSKIIPGQGDFRYSDLYHGEELTITDPSTTLAMNIPVDPLLVAETSQPSLTSRIPVPSFRRISTALLVLSLLLQGFVVVVKPGPLNFTLLIVYLGMLVLSRRLFHRKPKSWGVVYDVETKQEVPGAEIYITEEGNPRFSSRKVTDASGRAYLLLPPGKYHLFVLHPDYHFPIADELPGYRGEAVEVTADRPLIHIEIPVEKNATRHLPLLPKPADESPPVGITPAPGPLPSHGAPSSGRL